MNTSTAHSVAAQSLSVAAHPHDVGAVAGRHEEEGQVALGRKRKGLACDGLVDVDLVGHHNCGDALAVVLQLGPPRLQVLVCHLACDIEDHDTRVRAVVVGRMHAVEALLASGVP